MLTPNKFIKLMKSEPKKTAKKAAWIVDESKFLSFQEIIRLRKTGSELKTIGQNIRRMTAIRRWFVIELCLHTGLRVSEMASLQYKSIFLDKDKSSILVKGKGGKKRIVWIGSQFRAIFRVYNSLKESFGYATNDSSFILMNLEGNNISKRSLQEDFKLAGKLANLPKRYSIHSLRHTYATLLLRASNYNYRFVQLQLGHASINTTQVYAGVLEEEGRKAVEKLYSV